MYGYQSYGYNESPWIWLIIIVIFLVLFLGNRDYKPDVHNKNNYC